MRRRVSRSLTPPVASDRPLLGGGVAGGDIKRGAGILPGAVLKAKECVEGEEVAAPWAEFPAARSALK